MQGFVLHRCWRMAMAYQSFLRMCVARGFSMSEWIILGYGAKYVNDWINHRKAAGRNALADLAENERDKSVSVLKGAHWNLKWWKMSLLKCVSGYRKARQWSAWCLDGCLWRNTKLLKKRKSAKWEYRRTPSWTSSVRSPSRLGLQKPVKKSKTYALPYRHVDVLQVVDGFEAKKTTTLNAWTFLSKITQRGYVGHLLHRCRRNLLLRTPQYLCSGAGNGCHDLRWSLQGGISVGILIDATHSHHPSDEGLVAEAAHEKRTKTRCA